MSALHATSQYSTLPRFFRFCFPDNRGSSFCLAVGMWRGGFGLLLPALIGCWDCMLYWNAHITYCSMRLAALAIYYLRVLPIATGVAGLVS